MLPQLQAKCTSVYNFIRGGTWISQPFGGSFTSTTLAATSEPGNYTYQPAELDKFAHDNDFYRKFRKGMERAINMDFPCLFPGSPEEVQGTEAIKKNMREKLAARPGLYEKLEPKFVPGCRRLTPGPGYLEALTRDNVQLINTPIAEVTSDVSKRFSSHRMPVSVVANKHSRHL
jgi:cation diffusion facilitator CzcD-associated flavoprotein CzcO